MAASVRSKTTLTNSSTVIAPSGITDGDLLLFFAIYNNAKNPTITGFTLQSEEDVPYLHSGTRRYGLLTKVASSESGNYTLSTSVNAGFMLCIRDTDGFDSFASDVVSTNTTTITFPTLTPATNNTLILCLAALNNDCTMTAATGYTDDVGAVFETDGSDSGVAEMSKDAVHVSGATGTVNATLDKNSHWHATLTVAIKEVATAGGTVTPKLTLLGVG